MERLNTIGPSPNSAFTPLKSRCWWWPNCAMGLHSLCVSIPAAAAALCLGFHRVAFRYRFVTKWFYFLYP